jgi:hypothetical protein
MRWQSLFLACRHLHSGKHFLELQVQSWIKVQAVPPGWRSLQVIYLLGPCIIVARMSTGSDILCWSCTDHYRSPRTYAFGSTQRLMAEREELLTFARKTSREELLPYDAMSNDARDLWAASLPPGYFSNNKSQPPVSLEAQHPRRTFAYSDAVHRFRLCGVTRASSQWRRMHLRASNNIASPEQGASSNGNVNGNMRFCFERLLVKRCFFFYFCFLLAHVLFFSTSSFISFSFFR